MTFFFLSCSLILIRSLSIYMLYLSGLSILIKCLLILMLYFSDKYTLKLINLNLKLINPIICKEVFKTRTFFKSEVQNLTILLRSLYQFQLSISIFLKSLTVSTFLLSERGFFISLAWILLLFFSSFFFFISKFSFIWEGRCPPRLRFMVVLFHSDLDL